MVGARSEVTLELRESGVQRIGKSSVSPFKLGIYRMGVVVWTFLHVIVRRLLRGPRHKGWDFRYELAASMLRAFAAEVHRVPAIDLRRYAIPTRVPSSLRNLVKHELVSFSGLYAETFTPGDRQGSRTLLYLHGGGYFLCSPATHRDLIARLSVATRARTIAVDYRKAPEYPYPAGIDDCEQAYRALLAEGVAPEDIIVAGDSAGGGLALAVMLRARDAGLPLPGCAILLSPWCDLSRSGASIQDNADYDYLTPAGLVLGVETYLQGQDPLHPHVTHLRADLRGLPPLLVTTGSAELFYSENLELVARAREHAVPVTHVIEPGRVHVSPLLASIAPSAAGTFTHIEAFIAAHSAASALTQGSAAAS